jgi:hypothetical protein
VAAGLADDLVRGAVADLAAVVGLSIWYGPTRHGTRQKGVVPID